MNFIDPKNKIITIFRMKLRKELGAGEVVGEAVEAGEKAGEAEEAGEKAGEAGVVVVGEVVEVGEVVVDGEVVEDGVGKQSHLDLGRIQRAQRNRDRGQVEVEVEAKVEILLKVEVKQKAVDPALKSMKMLHLLLG